MAFWGKQKKTDNNPQNNQPLRRPDINDVFTPRGDVKKYSGMYINRNNLESSFQNYLHGNFHIVISGESGYGKSWLYEKILHDLKDKGTHTYEIINLTRFPNHRLEKVFEITYNGPVLNTEQTSTEGSSGVKIALTGLEASGGVKIATTKELEHPEPQYLNFLLKKINPNPNPNKKTVMVFDDFDARLSDNSAEQATANAMFIRDFLYIIRGVTETYPDHNVRLVIICTMDAKKKLVAEIAKQSDANHLNNRLRFLEPVSYFNRNEVEEFVIRGFVEKLGVNLDNIVRMLWVNHIYDTTLGVPQAMHEYCLHLAYLCQGNNWHITQQLSETSFLPSADKAWHDDNTLLQNAKALLRPIIRNRRANKHRVLYTLSQIQNEEFERQEVVEKVRYYFRRQFNTPSTIDGQIQNFLDEFLEGDNPILKKDADSYSFANAYYKIWLRLALRLDHGEAGNEIKLNW